MYNTIFKVGDIIDWKDADVLEKYKAVIGEYGKGPFVVLKTEDVPFAQIAHTRHEQWVVIGKKIGTAVFIYKKSSKKWIVINKNTKIEKYYADNTFSGFYFRKISE